MPDISSSVDFSDYLKELQSILKYTRNEIDVLKVYGNSYLYKFGQNYKKNNQ